MLSIFPTVDKYILLPYEEPCFGKNLKNQHHMYYSQITQFQNAL